VSPVARATLARPAFATRRTSPGWDRTVTLTLIGLCLALGGPPLYVHAASPLVAQVLPAPLTQGLAGLAVMWLLAGCALTITRAWSHEPWRLGVARLANLFPIPADCGHPAPYCAEERAYRNARFMDIYVAEMGAPERDAQVRAVVSLGDRPLIVLTASDHSEQGLPPQSVAQFERDWRGLQAGLASLSSNSQHRLVEGSRHGTLQTTYAGVTSYAIWRVIEAARTGQPLPR
jgi:hypothetical protein